MTDVLEGYDISWVRSITDVNRDDWNRLAHNLKFPFMDWEWFKLLEDSKSITPDSGWAPAHLIVRAGDKIVGIAPLFLRDRSEGEFIFDKVWVEVANKSAITYYPKLVGMSPYTPATGYRFLIDENYDEVRMTRFICQTIDRFCIVNKLGSCAFNFVDKEWAVFMEHHGYAAWKHQGYVWENKDFRTFDCWLKTLNSNRRKTIKRERREIRECGLSIKIFSGYDIPDEYFDYMYDCYVGTNEKFGVWSCKFLTKEFFINLCDVAPEKILFTAALKEGQSKPVGMAMFVFSESKLWGRYWGCFEEHRFMHFELCYYAPIEWAIENGVDIFDPGMGGEHKARRGFLSTPSYSLHRFTDTSMDLTFKTYIQEVNNLENGYISELNDLMPVGKKLYFSVI